MQGVPMWDTVIWGNTLTRWAIAAGVGLGIVVVLRIVASIAARRIKILAAKTATDVDDLIADLLDRTKLLFVVIVAVWAGSLSLELSPTLQSRIRAVLILGLLLQAAFWATGLVNYLLAQYQKRVREDDPSIATALGAVGFLARLAVWAVIVLIALDTLGVDITALVTGLGVGGIAIALAVQNILKDLFASLSILLDRPFVVGDYIVVGDSKGTVEHVGLKTTRMRSLTGEQLVIANSDLLSSRIQNYKRMDERRMGFEVGVVYGTPAEKLERVPDMIREAVEAQEKARFDRSHFKGFGDSSLLFETVYWMRVPEYVVAMDTQQAINLELYRRFEAEGLDFAFPTRTLFVQREDGASEPAGVGEVD